MSKAMQTFINLFKTFHIIERVLIVCAILSIIAVYIFKVSNELEIVLPILLLGVLYFPLGFSFLKNALIKKNYQVPITLGLFYALSTSFFLLGSLSTTKSIYPFLCGVIFLILPFLFIVYQIKKGIYKEYYFSQLIRVVLLLAINIVGLLPAR
jgi:hypothetical protein